MRRMLLIAMALGLPVAGTGCATALNMQDASLRKPYGGFRMPLTDFFGGGEHGDMAALLFWPFWLIDKPFSLFADTLSLPYILYVQRDAQDTQPSEFDRLMQLRAVRQAPSEGQDAQPSEPAR